MPAAGKMASSIECLVDDVKPQLGPRFAARVQYEPNPKNLDWDYIVARTDHIKREEALLKQRGLSSTRSQALRATCRALLAFARPGAHADVPILMPLWSW
ncbi:hypothetical protein MES5069_40137 [Mesorhizobium escarrei]|uniref:Uncharacterized protein n=1 Tax=Mesorhizobium escarrei TaxID=666018 RepID=A0ABM9E461_9HYPH|nr:hypothetical protein MES5069_40137 [Mesorhizobium escarrei]